MNNLLKKSLSSFIALSLICALTACTPNTPQTTPTSSETPQSSDAVENTPSSTQPKIETPVEVPAFPIKITDHAGREITIEKPAKKIVSGYYITSSLTIALGLKDNVVGIEAKAGTRPIYKLSSPDMLNLPNVGTAKDFNLEGCIALKPDLVIVPLKLKESAEALSKVGINTICVNPENEVLLNETIAMIAKATGTTPRAEELIKYSADKKAELSNVIKDAQKPTVYMAGNSNPLTTSGSKMYQNTLILDAGGTNVAENITDTQWAVISPEQLIAYNPDFIIIPPLAEYTKSDIANNPALADLKAVKENKVFEMPKSFESWDSPVPSTFLGTLWLAATIHPQLYSYDSFITEATTYYNTYYGFMPDKGAF